jgi:uncharacterized protein (TIGR01370 family)
MGLFGAWLYPANAGAREAVRARRRIPGGAAWAVYYGSTLPPDAFLPYSLVVLDPNYPFPIAELTARGAMALGYVSVGEFSMTGRFAAQLTDRSALVRENPNWPGSFVADVRVPSWRRFIVETVTPQILAQGFTGVFVDTLDSALHLETLDPERFRGMRAAAVSLLVSMRKRHGDIPIMMNRGYPLLGEVSTIIDAVLAESLVTTYDFTTRRYALVSDEAVAGHAALLEPARNSFPPAPVFSLDYWDPDDSAGIGAIYARERAMGHTPYVATILLDRIVPEPPHGA